MPRHLIPSRVNAQRDQPPPSPLPLPHSSQTAFVCFCRNVPGAVLNQTVATLWFSTGLLTPMIDSTIFTAGHVHMLALHPNQTRSRGRTGSVDEWRRHSRTESSSAWRAANSARFPVLAVEAKRYLSASPTSVASERFFSSAAQV